jgi:hypothetical protein
MNARKSLTGALAVLTAATAVATLSAATDTKAPRIVSAAMQDSDGDARADRLRLTYSERVRHAADRDGRYPFRVAGYAIRSVGAASGPTIVVALAEKRAADGTARPAVRYAPTAAGRVSDLARNQAPGQTFRATRAHGGRPAPTTPPPPPPPPPPANSDRDKDGVDDALDCGPTDPAIKPGAPDEPDLLFVDSNCDGIDGDEKNAIFASPTGKDTNPGTKAAPKREITAAVAVARAAQKDVYAAAGSYERVVALTGVGIYGGYAADTWKRGIAPATKIAGRPEGLFADGATQIVLQLLEVDGLSTGAASASAYGIRAINGSRLTLQRVAVSAGNGTAGQIGADGKRGVTGGPGENGAVGSKNCADGARRPGGAGGDSAVGRLGGKGGDGGKGGTGAAGAQGRFGTAGGSGGKGGGKPKNGEPGQDGTRGEPGLIGDGGTNSTLLAGTTWRGVGGGSGRIGGAGNGGGGGGGGGYNSNGLFQDDWVGSGGGGGGGGGGPGGVGDGGGFGGGSFGVYLHDSTIVATSGSISAGSGGAGGRGGHGGLGGEGGNGGRDAGFPCGHGGRGGKGGRGGDGGAGGAGGGGAGGPSIGVMKVGTSSATLSDVTFGLGTPGRGGATGIGGSGTSQPAQQGVGAAVHP